MTDDRPTSGFADWLASMSKALGYPREADLARALQLPQSTVNRWRKGSRPSVEHLFRVSRLLRTDIEPLLALSGHIPADLGPKVLALPPEPPSATTETVRRIYDADLSDEAREVLLEYWDRRLHEERSRVYAFIDHFSSPPEHRTDENTGRWLARVCKTDVLTHVADAFFAFPADEGKQQKKTTRKRGVRDARTQPPQGAQEVQESQAADARKS